jgi:hypothetical protein
MSACSPILCSRGWFTIWFANSAHELMSAYSVKMEQMATVEPESLEGLADVVHIREADDTWHQFLREWKSGYEQHEKTGVTKFPLPRIDL